MENKGLHTGHRDRMRARIEEYGIETLLPHEVLEYVLYCAVPRKDTNELAHNLINQFGSLPAVFEASVPSLLQVKGMTKTAAVLLHSIPGISRVYNKEKRKKKPNLNCLTDVVEYISPILDTLTREEAHVLCKDSQGGLICMKRVGVGVVDKVDIYEREIIRIAIENNAVSVILVHNHPSGNITPSAADKLVTEHVKLALTAAKIHFDDHIIISKYDCYSFAADGNMHDITSAELRYNNGEVKEIRY